MAKFWVNQVEQLIAENRDEKPNVAIPKLMGLVNEMDFTKPPNQGGQAKGVVMLSLEIARHANNLASEAILYKGLMLNREG